MHKNEKTFLRSVTDPSCIFKDPHHCCTYSTAVAILERDTYSALLVLRALIHNKLCMQHMMLAPFDHHTYLLIPQHPTKTSEQACKSSTRTHQKGRAAYKDGRNAVVKTSGKVLGTTMTPNSASPSKV
jgi:hypothetical protein